MAGLIPQSFIDDLLDRVDIVDVIDRRVKLKKTGKNYSACCPFHDEKTPSFTVSPDKQFYYCFGCGATGNTIGFLIDYERVGFPEAVEALAGIAGVEVPREAKELSPAQRQRELDRKNIFLLLEKADRFYQQQLRSHGLREVAVNYLKSRGLSGTIARDFGIGYAPPGWDNLLKVLGQGSEDIRLLVEAGLLVEKENQNRRHYDRFRERITFPIRDQRGRVIGFGGRVLGNDKPKYLNSPESPVFHKGQELYGLYEARNAYRELPRLLIVEGYMDVIALAQFDIRYAVATLGTACGPDHLEKAFKSTDEVIFCFDGDNAGRNAAKRALECSIPAMEDGRRVKFLFLPEGEDPDSLVRQLGTEKFSHRMETALPLEDFLLEVLGDGLNLQSMDGRARLSKLTVPWLNKLPKGFYRQLMFEKLSKLTDLALDVLQDLISEPAEALAEEAEPGLRHRAALPPEIENFAKAGNQEINEGGYSESFNETGRTETDRETPPPGLQLKQTIPVKRSAKAYSDQQVALTPTKMLIVLVLNHTELAKEVSEPEQLKLLTDPDIELFISLIKLLHQRPNRKVGHILGYWQGRYGPEATERLSQLAATQLVSVAKQHSAYDPVQEFRDALQRTKQKVEEKHYKDLPADTRFADFKKLSDEQKQQLNKALQRNTKDCEFNEL